MPAFDPADFLARAVGTPSHEAVGPMRDLLVAELESRGVGATVDDAGTVLATRGEGDPHLVLNTHLDTVPPHVPYRREGGTVHGRGACDAKGPLAAMLGAFLRAEPRGRVTLAVTPDEERHSTGAAALARDAGTPLADADGYVVGEPTGLDACNAARGRYEATVTLSGVAAHAAEPGDGVNAVAALGPALDALAGFDDRPDAHPAHPTLGPPTLVPTVVAGGGATNRVPDECRLTVDRRPVPAETADGFRAALERYLRAVLAGHLRAAVESGTPATAAGRVGVEVALADRPTPFLGAWETPADARLVGLLRDAGAGEVRPFGAATEASYFAADAPTVVFGPGVLADDDGPVAHADREYVRVEEVEAAAAVLTEVVGAF